MRHFEQLDFARRRVYRCIEALLLMENVECYIASLQTLYGKDTLQQAQAMLRGEQRFFGLLARGMELAGCDMHQRLLAAYSKLNRI